MSPTATFVGTFSAYVTVILPTHGERHVGDADRRVHRRGDRRRGRQLRRDRQHPPDAGRRHGRPRQRLPPAGCHHVIGFDAVSTNGRRRGREPRTGRSRTTRPRASRAIDTFTYEISGGIGTDTATVTHHGRPRWSGSSTARAAPGGDGRQDDAVRRRRAVHGDPGRPGAEPGDTVFLYRAGGAPYTGPLTLLATRSCSARAWTSWWAARRSSTATGNPLLTGAGGTTLTLGAEQHSCAAWTSGTRAGTGIFGLAAGTLTARHA